MQDDCPGLQELPLLHQMNKLTPQQRQSMQRFYLLRVKQMNQLYFQKHQRLPAPRSMQLINVSIHGSQTERVSTVSIEELARLQQDDWITVQGSPSRMEISRVERPPPTYFEPIGHLKVSTVENLKKKRQKEMQEELAQTPKKSKFTLNQIYEQKEPLYEKYKTAEQKKKILQAQKMRQERDKETKGLTLQPSINKTIHIAEPFESRLLTYKQRSARVKQKALEKSMGGSTFKPKINPDNGQESRVKAFWSAPQNKSQITPISQNFQGTSESRFTTGSLFGSRTFKEARYHGGRE